VGSPDAAVDLQTIERATELSREENFEQMEIYVEYDDPACELVLALRANGKSGQKSEVSRS
jgi:hypothetical protein